MENIIELLKHTSLNQDNIQIQHICMQGYTYDNLFKLISNGKSYSIKVRNLNDWNIRESLYCLNIMIDENNFIHTYCEVIKTNNSILLISEWIEGNQPIEKNREDIKHFFKNLGRFNKTNICDGPYTSMYLDGIQFSTIDEMVETELNQHLVYYKGKHSIKDIRRSVLGLCAGIGAIINEDMNTGNMIIDNEGNYKILDTEYLLRGLNLYQLDHVNFLRTEKSSWSNITNEAKESLYLYFKELGTNSFDITNQLQAYYLMSELRKLSYLIWKKDKVDFRIIDNNIDNLLNEKFVLTTAST